METRLNPYLNFAGQAQEALEFYHGVFGGELTMSRYGDVPDMPGAMDEPDKIMHGQLAVSASMVLMVADLPASMPYSAGGPHSLSLSGDDAEGLRSHFAALAEGGSVTMALAQAPWGDTFGMCTDRFGISWMINITGDPA